MLFSNKVRPIDCNNCPLLPFKDLWGWKYSFEKSPHFFSFWQNFETHWVKLGTVHSCWYPRFLGSRGLANHKKPWKKDTGFVGWKNIHFLPFSKHLCCYPVRKRSKYIRPWTTKLTWTVDSFKNFQNAVFLKISQIPSIG